MNPAENESVVAELLRASEGSLELVDRRAELPNLIARPGMSTWKVLSEGKSRREQLGHPPAPPARRIEVRGVLERRRFAGRLHPLG